jgi:general secretion pathway protein C
MLISLLQRYFLWIFIGLSGLMGLAAGHLGATALGLLAIPGISTSQTPALPPLELPQPLSLSDYQPILARNIFNSEAGEQSLSSAAETDSDKAAPTKTASKWTLIGTLSGGKTPLAMLASGSETETYALNQELPDAGILAVISRNRVEIRYPKGQTVILEMSEEQQISSRSRGTQPASRPAPQAPGRESSGPEIESIGENSWLIPAEVAEDSRSNIGGLLKQAQAVPYLEGSTTTGFQLVMVQNGSFIDKIGLKKGDILREINGVELTSPEKALQIFGQLRQAKQISIGLERGGEAMTFAYEIR